MRVVSGGGKPVRLQLSRKKGFHLQQHSLATNGLPAVKVTRPGKWGNPFDFRKSEYCWTALSYGCRGDPLGRQEASVRAFRLWIDNPSGHVVKQEETPMMGNTERSFAIGPTVTAGRAPEKAEIIAQLRGKNLACFCRPGDPCHADVLLDLANAAPDRIARVADGGEE